MQAIIVATSTRNRDGCQYSAELRISRNNLAKTYRLPEPGKHTFAIVDFSPDAQNLLITSETGAAPNEQFRNVELSIASLSSGQLKWHNAWDLFGWKACDAMVEPQGFAEDGRVAIEIRSSVMSPPRRPNCVGSVQWYTSDLAFGVPTRLPATSQVPRNGKGIVGACRTCRADPDIVGECFTVHGRLRAGNGNPTLRIWRVGTRRILGVHNDIIPPSLFMKMGFGVDAFGDFLVCPFSPQIPGEMQSVCVESAEKLVFQRLE